MRHIPNKLYDQIFDTVAKIIRASESGNTVLEQAGLSDLRALYARYEAFGRPDPALTEAMADFTDEAPEAVRLYRLALTQSAECPDEPTDAKRICMAERLVELAHFDAARAELILGRAEAERFSTPATSRWLMSSSQS